MRKLLYLSPDKKRATIKINNPNDYFVGERMVVAYENNNNIWMEVATIKSNYLYLQLTSHESPEALLERREKEAGE